MFVASTDVQSYSRSPPYHIDDEDLSCDYRWRIQMDNAKFFDTPRQAKRAGFVRLCRRCMKKLAFTNDDAKFMEYENLLMPNAGS